MSLMYAKQRASTNLEDRKETISFAYDYRHEREELIAFNHEDYVMEELSEAFAVLNHRHRSNQRAAEVYAVATLIFIMIVLLSLVFI